MALAGIAIDPLKAVVVNENVYVNKKLGMLFEKPNSWGFVAMKDFGKLKAEQIIGNGLDITAEEIWEDFEDPVCIATKYYKDTDDNKGIFSPTITLNITHKEELKELKCETFEEFIELMDHGTALILKDFKIIKRYDPYSISGCKFYEFNAEYMFEHIDIKEPLKVELTTLHGEHNGFYYAFNCHQCSAQKQHAENEFEKFKTTIKLV